MIQLRLKCVHVIDEELIRYAWPQDVWFHVDKLSSAHVYLRMPEEMVWENIPQTLLADCAQLVKANSIEGKKAIFMHAYSKTFNLLGNKKDDLTIIYTPAANLKVISFDWLKLKSPITKLYFQRNQAIWL